MMAMGLEGTHTQLMSQGESLAEWSEAASTAGDVLLPPALTEEP